MKRLLIGALALLCMTTQAERPFFVFDNGLTDVKSVEEQAKLLKELGYDGVCTRSSKCTEKMLNAFDQQGIKISATYVNVPAGQADLPPNVVRHIEMLKGRDTIVWLVVGNAKAGEEDAVTVIRNVHDLAAENGLPTVLYSHIGSRTDTIKRTEHLRKLAERPKLGISFNLCHFLAQTEAEKLEETLTSVAPHLQLVQLCGANNMEAPKADWGQLIQPLGEGSFDVGRVIRELDKVGYKGPVNLQCYRIAQPAKQHLSTSIAAWKNYNNP